MKKFYFLVVALCFFTTSFGQPVNYTKTKALGFSFFLNDFQTAAEIRANGLVSVLKAHNFFRPKRMNPGVAVNYLSGLSKHIDVSLTLGGSFVDYPVDGEAVSSNKFLLETTAGLNLKLLSDKYWVSPFIDLGVGAGNYGKFFSAFTPVGVGVQINLFDQTYLLINSQYRIPVTENAAYHFYHSVTIAGNIEARKAPAPRVVEVPVVTDRDGDGIVDSLDACPDQAGLTALQGCPDRDGDGIADKDDKCPDVAGIAKYQGCPIPDTDRDGINDEEDKCPNVPGVARYQGCPVPDTDGDGVNDEEDKCPNEAGPASNFGCPVIDVVVVEKVNKAAKNIFFATGSAKLLAKSYSSLKDVAQILKENSSYKIDVDGYTDITGSADKNQVLSENRANSVKEYLTANGVEESRINATGHGINDPIADNKTATGRAKNRRVEMKLRNY
ncbi:MAG: OmpA family protein [Ginsengibacter sp.]